VEDLGMIEFNLSSNFRSSVGSRSLSSIASLKVLSFFTDIQFIVYFNHEIKTLIKLQHQNAEPTSRPSRVPGLMRPNAKTDMHAGVLSVMGTPASCGTFLQVICASLQT